MIKRLRMFAGPNGSGKSTIIQVVRDAICIADKSYLFDNSYSEPKLIATVIDGMLTVSKDTEYVPAWFDAFVLQKIVK